MKKILLVILVVMCGEMYGQQIATLSIKKRLVETLTPFLRSRDDTASIRLLRRWDATYSEAAAPTQQMAVDSVPVELIAALYSKAASYPQGSPAILTDFTNDIQTIRVGALDAMCDLIDAAFTNYITNDRQLGRRYLTNKNN